MKTIIFLIILSLNILSAPLILRRPKPVWDDELSYYCLQKGLPYYVMRAIQRGESHHRYYCTEWQDTYPEEGTLRVTWQELKWMREKGIRIKKGVPISFGYFQVSLATCKYYCKNHNVHFPKNRVKFAYENSIKIGCISIAYNRKKYGDIKAAMCCHNIGPGRFAYRRKLRGKNYYYRKYINYINTYYKGNIWKVK